MLLRGWRSGDHGNSQVPTGNENEGVQSLSLGKAPGLIPNEEKELEHFTEDLHCHEGLEPKDLEAALKC